MPFAASCPLSKKNTRSGAYFIFTAFASALRILPFAASSPFCVVLTVAGSLSTALRK